VVVGMNPERCEVLLTTVLDAEPDARYTHPGPTFAPFLAALAVGVTFIGGIFTPWAFVVGPVLLFPPLLMWMATQDKQPGPPTWAEEPA
jgi:cytochrome c oxidase subunit I+III